MPRTNNFRKYHDGLKDMMDAVSAGGAPIRLPFPTARVAAGKRAAFYAMTRALEALMKETEEPPAKKELKHRLEMWFKVSFKVVRCGTEVGVKDGEWDEPAELLIIHQNQTKEALEMAALVRKSLGDKAQGVEGQGTGLPTDRSFEVMAGGVSIASLVEGVAEGGGEVGKPTVVSVDAVTGHQLLSDGKVLNKYGVFVGYAPEGGKDGA